MKMFLSDCQEKNGGFRWIFDSTEGKNRKDQLQEENQRERERERETKEERETKKRERRKKREREVEETKDKWG